MVVFSPTVLYELKKVHEKEQPKTEQKEPNVKTSIKAEKAYNFTIFYAGKKMKVGGLISQTLNGYTIREANKVILKTAKILKADYYDIEKQDAGYKVAHFKLPKL